MSDDLPRKLRKGLVVDRLAARAADRIEQLEAEVEQVRAAANHAPRRIMGIYDPCQACTDGCKGWCGNWASPEGTVPKHDHDELVASLQDCWRAAEAERDKALAEVQRLHGVLTEIAMIVPKGEGARLTITSWSGALDKAQWLAHQEIEVPDV